MVHVEVQPDVRVVHLFDDLEAVLRAEHAHLRALDGVERLQAEVDVVLRGDVAGLAQALDDLLVLNLQRDVVLPLDRGSKSGS